MTYPETIKYLESFINYEKIPSWPYKESLKLERIRGFLAIIGNPQDSLQCIHIAGSKGKGSTCAFIAYILRQAGYKVGLYTSPHLSDFRERIRILRPNTKHQTPNTEFEGMISRAKLADLVKRLKPTIEKYNQISQYGPLSFFEVYTALAFIYFKEKEVDFAVLETGLGGRLDATNVVSPLVCAITSISYEHTQKLGNTLKEIAAEKAGIIKNQKSKIKNQKLVVITAPQEKEALQVIRDRSKLFGAKLFEVGKDITYKRTKEGFNIKGIFGNYTNLKIKLLGKHQLINATVAVGVIEALRHYDIHIKINSMRRGLYNTLWPGRCEVAGRNPFVVLDGAQNLASIQVLKKAIREEFSARGGSSTGGGSAYGRAFGGKYKKLILVLGISSDKDIPGICRRLYNFADEVILTQAQNPRATTPEVLAQYFPGKLTHITKNVKETRELAKRLSKKEDLVLVTGSLFVVGEYRRGYAKPQLN